MGCGGRRRCGLVAAAMAVAVGEFDCADEVRRVEHPAAGGRPFRGLVAHHKTGSVVVMAAHRAASEFLRDECGFAGATSRSWLGGPLPAAFANETYEGWAASGPPRRVAHLLRSPHDWVASSYLYHRSGDVDSLDQAWLRLPFSACGAPPPALKDHEARWFRASCAAAAASSPRPRPDEGYAAFLRRLPAVDGLAAEQRFMFAATLGAVGAFLDARYDDYRAVCLEELMASRASCEAAWADATARLFDGPGPNQARLAARIAAATCAGGADHATAAARAALEASTRRPCERSRRFRRECFVSCFEHSMGAIDASKDQPHRRRCDRDRAFRSSAGTSRTGGRFPRRRAARRARRSGTSSPPTTRGSSAGASPRSRRACPAARRAAPRRRGGARRRCSCTRAGPAASRASSRRSSTTCRRTCPSSGSRTTNERRPRARRLSATPRAPRRPRPPRAGSRRGGRGPWGPARR